MNKNAMEDINDLHEEFEQWEWMVSRGWAVKLINAFHSSTLRPFAIASSPASFIVLTINVLLTWLNEEHGLD